MSCLICLEGSEVFTSCFYQYSTVSTLLPGLAGLGAHLVSGVLGQKTGADVDAVAVLSFAQFAHSVPCTEDKFQGYWL